MQMSTRLFFHQHSHKIFTIVATTFALHITAHTNLPQVINFLTYCILFPETVTHAFYRFLINNSKEQGCLEKLIIPNVGKTFPALREILRPMTMFISAQQRSLSYAT
jgi:hypothetical protein